MGTKRTGDFHKVYLMTGDPLAPALIKNVVSTELQLSGQAVDASSRDSKFSLYIPGKIDISASIVLNLEPDDASYIALRTAFINQTSVHLKFTTDAIAIVGTVVFEAVFMVEGISQPEQANTTVQITITLRPTPHATISPNFSTVTG
ncbi:MAG: hypothetical protein ACK55O_14440 [Phycisphaerales bacterium]|jgi:hypothetical protein|nr:hypothetical protein [Phycisphaeraceae bacterium]